MRVIAHLSDIHFGTIDEDTVQPLVSIVNGLRPNLVAISGDLTQRARKSQFIKARHFLSLLPAPIIVVPGNHDIPLYNLVGRFFAPLRNYRRFIIDELEPFYLDEEIAVLGINTARSRTFKSGRISYQQMDRIRQKFCTRQDAAMIKILVTHHPFDLPDSLAGEAVVGRATMAMQTMAACGVDLMLAGHYHVSETNATSTRYQNPSYRALAIHAGTATSTRGRGAANTFNILRIQHPLVEVERFTWNPPIATFEATQREQFAKTGSGWVSRPR